MNERIKELAEQSSIGWDEKYHWYVGSEQMKKFAELIIYECLSICEELGDRVMDGHYCADKILKHFGVKE